jgi:hypothetical protein
MVVAGSGAQRVSAAERKRRCRTRRSADVVRVSVDLTPAGIAASITAGFLGDADRKDAKAVQRAFVRAAVAGGLAVGN